MIPYENTEQNYSIISDDTVRKMADSNVELTKQELKSFRSQLFEIGLDEDNSRDKLQNIFDEYENKTIEPFVEEFLIAGFDVEIVRM